jgi:hypothetical protein
MSLISRLQSLAAARLAVTFAALALAQAASADSAASRAPSLTLTPREGQGLGTVSTYAGVVATLASDPAGVDTITLADAGGNEVNLVWTFWSHRQPHTDQWPSGSTARTTLTVLSPADVTLSPKVGLRVSGEWTEMVPGPQITLTAGQPTRLSLPLPGSLPVGAIETVRIQLVARHPIPELKFTHWSVGTQP